MSRNVMAKLLVLAICTLKIKSSIQHDLQVTSGCHFQEVTLVRPNFSENTVSEFLSYGPIWFRGNDSNKQLIIWVDNKQLKDLKTRLDRDGIQHLVSEERVCNHPRSDSQQHGDPSIESSMLIRKIPQDVYSEARSQRPKHLISVVHDLVIDYGDGKMFTNLFYSLKVVTGSETKKFTLGKSNYFVLGSLRSRNGLWSFQKSDTDGVFVLRNRAVLKSNEVVFDKNCFPKEANKPCLVFNPYSSPGECQLRFKLTTTGSTGMNIYAMDGSKENCLEYVEYPSGLFQIVLSDDNQNCAIFIPTLKADISSNIFFNVTDQSDTKSATLLVSHENYSDNDINISDCFNSGNDFKDIAIVASYKNAKPSKVLFQNLLNVVNNFFPEADDCTLAEGTTEMQCKFNQRLRKDLGFANVSTQIHIDTYISIHDMIEYEFSETVEAYMVAEILCDESCDSERCTRVQKVRLPDDLLNAVVPSKILKSRTGTIKLAKGIVFEHRVVDENSNTDPPEMCTS